MFLGVFVLGRNTGEKSGEAKTRSERERVEGEGGVEETMPVCESSHSIL